jgi:hypothetical protein
MQTIIFQLTQSKTITIRNLTNELFNENWSFQWFACREKNCVQKDNTLYSIKNINGENIIDKWVKDTQVEVEFFEMNTPNNPYFYICVLIDKENGEEPCLYSAEVEVIDSREPEILLDLSELDCLDITGETKNIEINGKLSIKFAPKLKEVELNISNQSNILIINSTIVDLVETGINSDFIEYEFKFSIDILSYGAGNLNVRFITQSGSYLNIEKMYDFFIIPDLQQLLNPTTTLPFSCSSDGGVQNNNAPSTFENNHTITTILDLRLFDGFLNKFVFIYSIAEDVLVNFCDGGELDFITSFREITRINGSQINGNSHTFIATLTPQQLNNLPRPFTYAVRLEARRIDIGCSNIVNLKGWTVLSAAVVCRTKFPYQVLDVEII